MWRTDLVFQWRDRLRRASPLDISVVEQILPANTQARPCPHVILMQGLSSNQAAVLVTVTGTGQPFPQRRQFAHVFTNRIQARDIIRLAVPEDFAHRPAIVQLHGRTYHPGDELVVQTCFALHVIIALNDGEVGGAQASDEAAMIQTTLQVDLLRKSGSAIQVTQQPKSCKPGPLDAPTDMPMTHPRNDLLRPPPTST